MSYCRWSSLDFWSDVYVYEDAGGGWTTHVAGCAHAVEEPMPKPVPCDPHDDEKWDAWFERVAKVREVLDRSELCDIDLPSAGRRFNDPTPGECADRLESLRAEGFIVPQYAVDDLRAEALPPGDERRRIDG